MAATAQQAPTVQSAIASEFGTLSMRALPGAAGRKQPLPSPSRPGRGHQPKGRSKGEPHPLTTLLYRSTKISGKRHIPESRPAGTMAHVWSYRLKNTERFFLVRIVWSFTSPPRQEAVDKKAPRAHPRAVLLMGRMYKSLDQFAPGTIFRLPSCSLLAPNNASYRSGP